jgi:hypothetical protein
MSDYYSAFDPAAEIRSENLNAVFQTLQVGQERLALLSRFELPSQPQEGEWYSWQVWVSMLEYMKEHYGSQIVYSVGLQVINESIWPPNIHTLHEALNALDTAYKLNIRGEYIGSYSIEGKGLRSIRIVCDTPNPIEFDRGIITGIGRKFKPLGVMRVQVEPERTPSEAPVHLKWLEVSW